jgi:hypothetical protein
MYLCTLIEKLNAPKRGFRKVSATFFINSCSKKAFLV